MSDYIFMLESHLSSEQNGAVAMVQAAASLNSVNLFLTGGAVRDMLGGFQVRDLDFTVEGDALKVAATLKDTSHAHIVSIDEKRGSAEVLFPNGVRGQIATPRAAGHGEPSAGRHVFASIHDDLRRRDFSVNAMALSLNPASRGLLIDPTNGQADLERRELRSLTAYGFYDDPSRLLRLVRLRVRLGFALEERTRIQYQNARAANAERSIPPRVLFEEMKQITREPSPAETLKALDSEKLLQVFSTALAGPKLNMQSVAKMEKTIRMLPGRDGACGDFLGPFLHVLTGNLTPRERAGLFQNMEMTRAEVDAVQQLELRARKLEQALKSTRVRKPSQVYEILSKAAPDELCIVLYRAGYRPVQERVRNYFEKYLPLAREFRMPENATVSAPPGSRRFEKKRQAMLAAHLDRRPRRSAAAQSPADAAEPADAKARSLSSTI